jgi:hypothetical protein
MIFFTYLLEVLSAVLTKNLSLTIGGYTITATDTAGTPVHFTLSSALLAVENVLEGKTGTVQSGDITITIAKA